jgi:hypothetical protein
MTFNHWYYATMSSRPFIDVAVVMRRERVLGEMAKWQAWRWVLDDVTPQEENFGDTPKCLRESDDGALWLFPNFKVELYSDDAEGYLLNVTSPDPCFFVMWRMEEQASLSKDLVAVPERVSLSYHDAGRWLDAQETIEQVPASQDIVQWVREFANDHYTPEVKRRQRPQSFQALTDRFGQPAKVTTGDRSGRKVDGA